MTEEIKEIIDYLIDEECTRRIKCITIEESKQLLDYIKNLQQDLDKANDIIGKDRQFYKCRMDEYVDLKKENEELKQTLHNITINGVEEENTTVLDLIKENKRLKRERQRLLYNLEKVCEERDEEQ